MSNWQPTSFGHFALGFILASIICITVAIFMVMGAVRSFQRAAIDHGVATWVCDPVTGETAFKWKVQPEAEP